MLTNSHNHLRDNLFCLQENLKTSPKYYFTERGLSLYFEGVVVEIEYTINQLQNAIAIIEQNDTLFSENPIFDINYYEFKKEMGSIYEKYADDPCVAPAFKTHLLELINLLQKAHNSLNNPSKRKKLKYYDVLFESFQKDYWPAMKTQFRTECLDDLSFRVENRRKQLEFHRDDIRANFEKNPVVVCKKANLVGDVMDEISKDGELIPESLAHTIFKNKDIIASKEYVIDFFRLFYIYQIVCNELALLETQQADNGPTDLESWFLEQGGKLKEVVKTPWQSKFPALLTRLCQEPDLKAAFHKSSLKCSYNLKLAYNLFGLMLHMELFQHHVNVTRIDVLISEHRQYQYIRSGCYNNDDKYNEMSHNLRQKAIAIINEWLKTG